MRVLLITFLTLFIFGFSATAVADEQTTTYELDIKAQALPGALKSFAEQTDLQVVYFAAVAEGKDAPALEGEFTADAALDQLLANADLEVQNLDARTYSIAPVADTSEQGADSDSGNVRPQPVLMAQNETASSRERTTAVRIDRSSDRPVAKTVDVRLPEIITYGKRTYNADIERTIDDTQPYVVFGAETIEAAMSSDLESFLKSRLPMNHAITSSSQSEFTNFSGQSAIDLRGLGTNQTLILVNGRRMPSVSDLVSSGDFQQPDINGIPLSAIERIEVLPATASGIYGGGATGGVVNIILKSDYAGWELSAGYENTFDSDTSIRKIEASGGFSIGGSTDVMLSASYADGNPLLVGDRDFAQRAQALKVSNTPNRFYAQFYPFLGATTNIKSTDGSDLVLDDGTPLNSPYTHVPAGYAGVASDGGAGLVANAGSYNLELPGGLQGLGKSLLGHPTRKSLSANLHHEFGERVEGYVNLSWFENEGRSLYGTGVSSTLTMDADEPGNPFATDIRVAYPSPNLSLNSQSNSDTFRGLVGLTIRLPGEWSLQTDFARNRSSSNTERVRRVYTSGFSAAIRAGEYNIFADLNEFPIDGSEYFQQFPNYVTGPSRTTLDTATVRVGGGVGQLPGGPLSLSGTLEYRKEQADDTFYDVGNTNGTTTIRFYPERRQSVKSIYLEALAPLLSDANARPGVHLLELHASARHDAYSTTSVPTTGIIVESRDGPFPELEYTTSRVSSTDVTVGLRYSPLRALTFRASYGTGFLPPSISQIASSISPFSNFVASDPKRGGESYSVDAANVTRGGNPNLESEESESFSAGMIFAPESLAGLRISVDFTDIRKTGEITTLPLGDIIEFEDELPGRVTREPLEDGAPPEYAAGRIVALDTTYMNISATRVKAVDFRLDYGFTSGEGSNWQFYLAGSRPLSFERQTVPSAEVVDSVGFSSGPLKWRANGGVNWERNALSIGWSAQFYASQLSYYATASEATRDSLIQVQGSETIRSQIYHDLHARYRLDGVSDMLADSELVVGIQNVLDQSPPIYAPSFFGYSSYGDPRMRRYSVTLNMRF